MKPENAIEVTDITKKFKLYVDKGHTLKEKTLFRKRRAYQELKVLNGISFQVKKGEAIGLIGHNGCGKSTVLKLLTRIMYPDSGTIEMNGCVSSLIELGAGFHPDLSGRENIYINASIFGLTRKEIDNRLEDIIAFSELGEFIDNPVRTYSSGMYMRLAFSVAINVDADILLIDEILAVGDAGFQAKCFHRLKEIKAGGTTIVLVSHSMEQIEQNCDRSIWIHEGKLRAEGKPEDVAVQYLEYMEQKQQIDTEEAIKEPDEIEGRTGIVNQNEMETEPDSDQKRWGNRKAEIQRVYLFDDKGRETRALKTEASALIKFDYQSNETVTDAVFGIGIFRNDGIQCYGTNTRIDGCDRLDIKKDGSVSFYIDSMMLLPGTYFLDVSIECGQGIPVDFYREACKFEVISSVSDAGIVRFAHKWRIEN